MEKMEEKVDLVGKRFAGLERQMQVIFPTNFYSSDEKLTTNQGDNNNESSESDYLIPCKGQQKVNWDLLPYSM